MQRRLASDHLKAGMDEMPSASIRRRHGGAGSCIAPPAPLPVQDHSPFMEDLNHVYEIGESRQLVRREEH